MTTDDFETISVPHLTDEEINKMLDELISPEILDDLFTRLDITFSENGYDDVMRRQKI